MTKPIKKSIKKYTKAHITKRHGHPLGVITRGEEICLFVRRDGTSQSNLFILTSPNGIDFKEDLKKVFIKDHHTGKKENIKKCQKFSISRTPNGYVLTYVRMERKGKKLILARSKDLYLWIIKSELPMDNLCHTTLSYSKEKDTFELYRDGLFLKHQSSPSLALWKEKPSLVMTSRNGYFDSEKISIIGSTVTSEGILLLYDASIRDESRGENKTLLQVGAVLFDSKETKRILWRSAIPIWQSIVESKNKIFNIKSLGFIVKGKEFLIYWMTNRLELLVTRIPAVFKEIEEEKLHPKILNRFHENPIIEPRSEHSWEGEGTFNPAVLEDDEGTVHLLYRALGKDGISRIGYAKSPDGMYFNKRSSFPIFEPSPGYGMPDLETKDRPVGYHPAIYTSGGGWGGAEDPRIVQIETEIYMTYVAFEGWNSVRIAVTSISVDDFKKGKWKWRKPTFLSPPGKVNKNWVLFPEKIKGKFALLHSIAPKVSVDYIDDLNNLKNFIDSPRREGPQPGREKKWDNFLRGAGPPPLKTNLGWLLLYHALDRKDFSKYRLGAMILDRNDPTKVLYRSSHPILSPDMHYENNGKPGIVYASGMNVRGDDLYVYYGGADKVVCVATTPLQKFLKYLTTGNARSYQLSRTR